MMQLSKQPGRFSRSSRSRCRRGVVLVAVVVLIAVSLALFGVWVQAMVREHGQMAGRQWRLQASRLAEAGLQRAIARQAADRQFSEETWVVPAEQLGGVHAGEVRIHITTDNPSGSTRYEATAEFPSGSLRRARLTRSIEIPKSTSGDET